MNTTETINYEYRFDSLYEQRPLFMSQMTDMERAHYWFMEGKNAAIQALSAQNGWQKIESAPRGFAKKIMLGKHGEEPVFGFVTEAGKQHWHVENDDIIPAQWKATHYQIPHPPTKDE